MYAVIKTGGKQYKVAEGDKVRIDKIEGEAGDVVAFDQVLMLGGEDGVTVGSPVVDGAQVMGELVDISRGRKIIIFKKRRRQNSRRKNGHRQWSALVSISEIVVPGAQPKTKASSKPKVEKSADAPKAAASEGAASGHDDLKELTGVGPALEKKLVEAGVTSFAQIASWSEADIDALEAQVPGVKAKAEKGDWVAEAKAKIGA
ncbi:50S ribosomal protein L21 [Woodsholea maritima]|uniref:50S ribosomal protein L21 n=1 Tax=Woodsholea maritima TaxID=240237 RepID=UPI00036518DA|nr:50S ribosomal protein L21 [Woodsholea maritima]